VDRFADRLANAPVRQADVRRQHAVRESGQGLNRAVGVNRRQASEVPGVQWA